MAIKDLISGKGFDVIEGTIVEVGDVRTFNKFGKEGRVTNTILQDETGKVKLSLFNEQIDQIHLGDQVKITKGFCKEWQGELQVSAGQFGKMEVVGQGSVPETPKAAKPAQSSPAHPAVKPAHPAPAKVDDDPVADLEEDADEMY